MYICICNRPSEHEHRQRLLLAGRRRHSIVYTIIYTYMCIYIYTHTYVYIYT